MPRRVSIAVAVLLIVCQDRKPAVSNAEFAAFKASHPGMTQACLDEVRYGGFVAWRPDDPDCYEMLAAQRWGGLWEHGWEWTNFCPDPAKQCDWMAERGTWLIFAESADPGQDLPEGVHRIEFVGRRTRVPGNFGHTNSYDHLMIVDRLISIQPVEVDKQPAR